LGMRLTILRETKMPAVLLSVGSVATAVALAPIIGNACVAALTLWVTSRQG
jgi:hypothetical protein